MRGPIIALLLSLSSVTNASAGDYSWSPDFAYEGFNGRLSNAVVFDGDLVVTGRFGANGDVLAPNIARWDGMQWLPMGDPGFDDEGGFALGVYQSELYAGGHHGGDGYLSKWDGSQWVDVASFNFESPPFNMATRMIEYDSLLVVTGYFSVSPNGIFMSGWNGSNWVHLGDYPNLNYLYGLVVVDMIVYDGDLFVGGDFEESIGSVPMNGLARWDGTTWGGVEGRSAPAQPLVEGLHYGAYFGSAYALAVHNGKLAIGGAFLTAGDLPAENLVTFDASTELWENIGSAPNWVYGLTSDGANLLATVHQSPLNGFDLREYNGSSWSSVGVSDGPSFGYFYAATEVYGGDHVVVGDFHGVDATHTPSVATWDGATVGTLANVPSGSGLGLPRRVVAMTEHDGELIAAIEHGQGLGPHGIVAFDGSSWRDIGRWVDAEIQDLASDGTSLYASGTFDQIETLAVPRVARWDGATWHAMGTSPPYNATLAIHGGTVYAATLLDVSYFDGGAWQSISVSQEGGTAVSYGGDLIVSSSVKPLSLWDGATWTPLTGTSGGTLNDAALDFAVVGGDLIMVGRFTEVDGVAGQVAVWDGSTLSAWAPTAIPDPPTYLSSIATFDGQVVMAGYGGAGLWVSPGQGSPWEVLCGGLGAVAAPTFTGLQVYGGELYVGGDFSVVGDQTGDTGVVASNVARLGPTPTAATDPAPLFAPPVVFPNPFNPTTTIRYSVPRPGAFVRIVVHDVGGREVRTLLARRIDGGRRAVVWDGRDDAGNAVASGTYFYRVQIAGEAFTGKMTLLK
jgi:hypothetical protein